MVIGVGGSIAAAAPAAPVAAEVLSDPVASDPAPAAPRLPFASVREAP
ncbi:MAG: hypothetical protein ACJ786_38275 [Catenulispora sp.]